MEPMRSFKELKERPIKSVKWHVLARFMWALSEEKNMKNKQLKYIVNCQAQLPPD